MNTISVITRIKQELDDQGIFYTDEDVFDSLQDGYEEISLRTECIEKVVSVAFPTTPYWKVTDFVTDYFRPIAIYDPNRKMFLTPTTIKILDQWSDSWETESGVPQGFVPIDFHYIAFYPYYATAPAQNMYLFYSAVAPDFTSSLTLQIPSNHQSVIEDYVVSDLLDQHLEIKKASTVYKDYIVGMQKAEKEMARRNRSDRIFQMMVQINANME